MKTPVLLLIAAILLWAMALKAQNSFYLTFNDATNLNVYHYSAYWLATNDPDANHWQWFGDSKDVNGNLAPGTNICCIPVGSIPNPCWLAAVTITSNNLQSVYSAPFLFDTNKYPVPIVTALPLPPFNLNVIRK